MVKCFFELIILMALLGCSKDPGGKNFSDLKDDKIQLKTTNQDSQVSQESLKNFDLENSLGIDEASKESSPWLSSTSDIFEFIEKSYLLDDGSSKNSSIHTRFANKLMDIFYQNQSHTTQYHSDETLYLEAALGYEREKIINKFESIGSRDNTQKLELLFNSPCDQNSPQNFCHSLMWPTTDKILEPKIFLESIKKYMLKTSEKMRELGVSQEFITLFDNKIQTDYISKIDIAYNLIREVSPERDISLNTEDLVNATQYLDFLPESIHKMLTEKLIPGNRYALILKGKGDFSKDMSEEISRANDNGIMSKENYLKALRILNVIGNIWLDLEDPAKKFEYIGNSNLILYETLLSQSSTFVKWISGRLSIGEYYDECGNIGVGCGQEVYLPQTWKSGYIEKFSNSCHGNVQQNIQLWLSDKEYRRTVKTTHPELYKIFTSFQDTVFKQIILKNFSSEERVVTVDNFSSDRVLSPKKTYKVIVSNFYVPMMASSNTRDIMRKFNAMVAPICLDDIQVRIEKALNNYILSSLDEKIRFYTSDIEKIVSSQTLKSQNDIAKALVSDEEFKMFFKRMADPIVNKMFFAGKTLNGLENSMVQFKFGANNKIESFIPDSSKFMTSGSALGQGLAANYYRLITLPQSQGISPIRSSDDNEPNLYYRSVFEQINKMLALIGFRKADKTQHLSLHRKFFGPIEELDVYKYDCNLEKYEKQILKEQRYKETRSSEDYVDWRESCDGYTQSSQSYFSVPDEIEIKNAFEIGSEVALSSSVKSQTQIIRGASLMLKYFKDWGVQNEDFDSGMGQEQYAGQNLFPKSAFVNLSLALATLPIRGLTKEHSNLMLFSAQGNEFVNWSKNGRPPQGGSDPVAMAAIGDVFSSGTSRIIKSSDLANFIISISEFLEATNRIEETKASVINPVNKKEKENLKSLMEGRKLLKLMVIGVSNFLTSQMQDRDGGFWHTIDLDRKREGKLGEIVGRDTTHRTLKDQLLVIEALLKAYDMWGGDGVYISAMDAYHYMNSKLYNPSFGYYSSSEGKFGSHDVDVFLNSILILKKISHVHFNSESREQAKILAQQYEEQWVRWIQNQLN